jgi:pimeloyl-ACP methyl ester carboxylesterase
MSQGKSLLSTAHDGQASGPAFLVLHERYGSLTSARELGQSLGTKVSRVAVRSARLQTIGDGDTYGFYWYVGPEDEPELSTLGDGLYQLELLLLETFEASGGVQVGLLGAGEGGSVALLMALIQPELVSIAVAIDAQLPANFAAIPIATPVLNGLPILLLQQTKPTNASTVESLVKYGANVTVKRAAVDAQYVQMTARGARDAREAEFRAPRTVAAAERERLAQAIGGQTEHD